MSDDTPLARAREHLHSRMADARLAVHEIVSAITTGEDYVTVAGQLKAFKELAADFDRALKDRALYIIRDTGEFTVGDIRCYEGTKNTKSVPDNRASMRLALKITDGDADAIADLLCADAFKPGALRALAEEKGCAAEADALIEVKTQIDVASGKPKRGLQQVDTRYTTATKERA